MYRLALNSLYRQYDGGCIFVLPPNKTNQKHRSIDVLMIYFDTDFFFLLVYSLPYCLLEMEIIRKMRVIATSTIDTLEACLNMN